MDVHPLIAKIEENARVTADSLLSEARARVQDLQRSTDEELQRTQEESDKRARQDALKLEESLRRLQALNGRKDLLERKRGLISQAFDLALERLRAQPTQKLREYLMGQLVAGAAGIEEVTPGDVNPGFFDESFLKEANAALEKAGKPGRLRATGGTRPGVCGLILTLPGSESHLTMETLLLQKRESLEADVAGLLCGGLS